MNTLLHDFESSVKAHGERVALTYFGWRATYAELDLISNSVALQLSEFIRKGETLILCTQNIPQFPIVEYAAWKLGLTVLPANPSYTSRELSYIIKDSEARSVVVQCESEPVVREAVDKVGGGVEVIPTSAFTYGNVPGKYAERWGFREGEEALSLSPSSKRPELGRPKADDPALLVYTSGTTGDPKGAVLRHRNVHAGASIYRRWFRYTKKDISLGLAPFFHVTGLVFHLASIILSGASASFTGRFDPVLALETVEHEKTSITMLAATAYLSMLNINGATSYDLSSMRLWSSGGMAVPRKLEEDWKKLTGSWIYVAWGMTETSSPATLWPYPYNGPLPVDPDTGIVSSGKPVYNTRLKVIHENGSKVPDGEAGELCVRGPQVVDTYHNKPEATAKSFLGPWLRTGDLAKLSKGWVFIIDRKKDIINSSGFKIWPREVEEVLFEHPAVAEAAVVGIPDSYRGEAVTAFVSLKAGFLQSESLRSELIEHCRKRLAPYKVPRRLEFVDEIPKTLSGKLLRRTLKEFPN